MSITAEQKKLLQATAPTLREKTNLFTSKLYGALFKEHPEFLNYFNQTNQQSGKQPAAFAETIFHFVDHLDNLDAMAPQMSRLSNKHRAVTVPPELYPVFGQYFVKSVEETLGGKSTAETTAAWKALYNLITSIFIKREKELYEQLGNDKGFVPFTITKKENISSGPTVVITLQRQDGGKIWPYNAGQYITLRVEKGGTFQQGHYIPLDPANNSTYSVALRAGHVDQNTIVSEEVINNRQVGGTVLVSAPSGSFGLVDGAKSSLFIAGGIGIASLMGLINELNKQGKAGSISVIQCAETEDRAAFSDQLRSLLKDQYVLLTKDKPLSKNHLEGKLKSDTHVYTAGSEKFLEVVENALNQASHPKSQTHIKSIEPTLGLLKAADKK